MQDPDRVQPSDRACDLTIDPGLRHFVEDEVLSGLDISGAQFWDALSGIVHGFGSQNRRLLKTREDIQSRIDDWHRTNSDRPHDRDGYTAFLEAIG